MDKFIINPAGAKIYSDINKHTFLKIPVLIHDKEEGDIHEVLSVGLLGEQRDPIVTVRKPNQEVVVYRLPQDLQKWVQHSMGMRLQGFDLFPANVEFGKLHNRIFAEIL